MAENTEVTVTRNVTTAVRVGEDLFLVKQTEDGRGVNVEAGDNRLFIPMTAVAAVSAAILNSTGEPVKAKRKGGRPRKNKEAAPASSEA